MLHGKSTSSGALAGPFKLRTRKISSAFEDRRSVLVSLLGEVASVYVQLRSSQKRWEIARANLRLNIKPWLLSKRNSKPGLRLTSMSSSNPRKLR